ncbi:hypothetical protein [Lysinibacillus fusiformis]|uniref:hypothetical protein n=1 Tax=Lysinibacillus fusiformis TaxID=28031 RepID=UPI003D0377EC
MDLTTYQPSAAVREMLRAARRDTQFDATDPYWQGRRHMATLLIGFAVMYELGLGTEPFPTEMFDAWYAEQLAKPLTDR